MLRLFKRAVLWMVLLCVDFVQVVPSLIQVHILRAHRPFRLLHDAKPATRQKDVAIVAIFATKGLLPSTRHLLDAFKKRHVGVVVVSNAGISSDDLAYLKGVSFAVIQRANVGRDFGAFQCGLRFIEQRKMTIRKLFLANDSVYYLPGTETVIERCQKSGASLLGLTENYEFGHHLSSYFLVFDGAVHTSRHFSQFWDRYRPYSTRRHSIFKGEIGLSRHLIKKGGFAPEAMFEANGLRSTWGKAEVATLLEDHHNLTPIYLTDLLWDRDVAKISQLRQFSEALDMDALLGLLIVNRWMAFGEVKNQSHAFALLYVKYLGMPVLKRDLCQRGSYYISTLIQFLSGIVDPKELQDIERDLRANAYPVSVTGWRKFLFDTGRI